MPNAKKATSKKTNGHHRNGVIPSEQIELLKEQLQKLKTDKARDRFLEQLTLEEVYYLWLYTMDVERTKERLEMVGLM